MASDCLKNVDQIIYHNRSAVVEGDVFSVLAHSPYIIRSFEFGLADGAVDCSTSYDPTSNYADRFWEFDQSSRALSTPHEVLLFDVKGAVFDQKHLTNVAQNRHIAFYIGMCTADPKFIELIPNYLQDPDDQPIVTLKEDQKRYLTINNDRDSKMPLRTQGLNQTNAPFRMPLSMLGLAIDSIRNCARGQGIYVNPWTQVAFPAWLPVTTTSNRFLNPLERTANFTAYEATMSIYRAIRSQQHITGMMFDFVGLQPRVADFKLVQMPQEEHGAFNRKPRQILVQHKLHTKLLSKANKFENVNVVARRKVAHHQWYFSATNRFDYYWFQFRVSDDSSLDDRVEFFFIPERVIPDSFYVSETMELSFNRPDFLRYKIHMDDVGEWVSRIQRIIQDEPNPRKPGQRPLRPETPIAGTEFELTSRDGTEEENPDVKDTVLDQVADLEGDTLNRELFLGRSDYLKAMQQGHRSFFEGVMRQCAERLSGLVIVMSSDHPVGDFGFCRYRWTAQERDVYLKHGRIPRAAHHMPANTPTVPICYYSRHAGCSFEGPNIKPAVFRRLDACTMPRIVAWNLLGPDSLEPSTPVMIPSEDIGPSESQRLVFRKEAKVQIDKHVGYTPSLSSILNSGRFAAEYSVAKCGPLLYGNSVWGETWKVLYAFTGIDVFQHPAGVPRQPSLYQHSLRALHQRLAQELHHLSNTTMNP